MRVEKQAIIDEVSETVAGAEFVILTNCIGMTVAEMSALRGKLSERDSRLLVTKNTFIRIGAERAGKPGLETWLEGPTAMITGVAPITDVAKDLKAFAKSNERFRIKGGLMGTQVVSSKEIDALADLPSREVLLGRLLGTLAAPMTQLVGVLNQKVLSLLYVLKAIEDKKSGSGR